MRAVVCVTDLETSLRVAARLDAHLQGIPGRKAVAQTGVKIGSRSEGWPVLCFNRVDYDARPVPSH